MPLEFHFEPRKKAAPPLHFLLGGSHATAPFLKRDLLTAQGQFKLDQPGTALEVALLRRIAPRQQCHDVAEDCGLQRAADGVEVPMQRVAILAEHRELCRHGVLHDLGEIFRTQWSGRRFSRACRSSSPAASAAIRPACLVRPSEGIAEPCLFCAGGERQAWDSVR
ncbi:MAG: hypothetical protein WDN69_36015 [Aliidongia sp.]